MSDLFLPSRQPSQQWGTSVHRGRGRGQAGL